MLEVLKGILGAGVGRAGWRTLEYVGKPGHICLLVQHWGVVVSRIGAG